MASLMQNCHRFYRSIRSFFCLALILVQLAGIALAQDDHGNSPAEATAVVVGVTTSGAIETPGDTDFFSFSAQANYYYRIETFNLGQYEPGGDTCDTVIALYDSDGATVLAEDDQGGSEPDASKILWPCTSEKTVYLEIYHFFSTRTGTYDFIIEGTELPADDHSNFADETATELIPNVTPVVGNIEIPGDVDFFRFHLNIGLFYDLETSELSAESDTLLALYAEGEEEPLLEDDQNGREINASRIIFRAPENATYYGEVKQFSSSSTGSYQVGIRREGYPAAVIPDGTPVGGILYEAGDIDVFRLATEKDHLYLMNLMTDNFLNRFTVTVLDTDGMTQLAQNSFSSSNLIWQAPNETTYYLVIREDVEGGNYDLSVLDQGTPPPDADLNDDEQVNHEDLYLFQTQWMKVTPTPTATPIP